MINPYFYLLYLCSYSKISFCSFVVILCGKFRGQIDHVKIVGVEVVKNWLLVYISKSINRSQSIKFGADNVW